MTICKGIAKGRTIELDQSLPYAEGQPLRVSVEPMVEPASAGSPEAVLRAVEAPPHLSGADVAELDRIIEQGKIPVRPAGAFDAEPK